jgi:hypothetical protein
MFDGEKFVSLLSVSFGKIISKIHGTTETIPIEAVELVPAGLDRCRSSSKLSSKDPNSIAAPSSPRAAPMSWYTSLTWFTLKLALALRFALAHGPGCMARSE